jgi:hypothetical protein
VFFDASEIPGMADGDFLNAHITWDFGDARAGQYETTRGARNQATGFVVGHVFREPGSYEVQARIVDAQGKTLQAAPVRIQVDPFQGTARCLSTSGRFDGAPQGCETLRAGDLSQHLSWVDAGPQRRLYLRRGDTFQLGAPITLRGNGPALIGAFGSEKNPRPLVRLAKANESFVLETSALRLLDVAFEGGGVGFGGKDQVALGIHVKKAPSVGVGIGGDQIFVHDSVIEDTDYFAVYADGSRMSLAGNRMDQLRVATSFRRPPKEARDVYVAHNVIDASRPEPTTGIKWHSRRGVITDNILVAGMSRIALTTDSGDELTAVDEGLGMVLVERNVMRLSFGRKKPQNDRYTDAGVSFNTNERIVIRNNLLSDMSRAFADSSGGAEPVAKHVWIYNNSVVKGDFRGLNWDEGDFLSLSSPPINWHVFNNTIDVRDREAVSLIKLRGGLRLQDLSGLSIDHNVHHRPGRASSFLTSNDATDVPSAFNAWQKAGFDKHSKFAAPGYVSVDPDDARFLQLRPDSIAVDAGKATSLPFDQRMRPRKAGRAIDIGALELDAGR